MANGNYASAIGDFRRAIAHDPNFALAYGALGSAYTNLGESNLAQENDRKAFELRGEVSERERLGIEAGYYWNVAGDLEEARDAYELLVQTYPRDSAAHFNLGNVYHGLGRLEEGLAEARESFRLDPNSRMSHSYLAFSLVALNRLQEAEEIEKEALAKYLYLGRAYAMQSHSLAGPDADAARAKVHAAYESFLTLWKDADPEVPILKEAKAEYAKLQ